MRDATHYIRHGDEMLPIDEQGFACGNIDVRLKLAVKQPTVRPSERDLARTITQFLALKGWTPVYTEANLITRTGRVTVIPAGHADWLFVKPTGPGSGRMFYAELKRPMARTSKARLAKQAAWAEGARMQGYTVYRCPDMCADPWADFIAWFESFERSTA